MSDAEIVEALGAIGVIPVVGFEESHDAVPVAEALVRGGIGCIEVVFRTPASAASVAALRDVPGLLVGAGTLLSVSQLHAARDAGARFGLSPCLNPEVLAAARELGFPFFPGVATPSEIDHARRLGASVVKVFPASQLGGPAFLRAAASVFPDVRFIPTGGVAESDVAAYRAVAAVLAVGGSWLTPAGARPEQIEELAAGAREAITR